MKGVILAGGLGTRLDPLTKATNKHLLPIYDKPMIYYPIETLVQANITEVMVIVSGPHSGDFISILKNGDEFGLDSLQYGYQYKPDGGIADALSIARNFADGDDICVILGDNTTDSDISSGIEEFYNYDDVIEDNGVFRKTTLDEISRANEPLNIIPHAHIFTKEVKDPQRYGVAEFKDDKLINIIEKPSKPPSNKAVTGLYVYDHKVFDFIDQCEPGKRGELEITDVNNFYLKEGILSHSTLEGYWQDAGTFDSLYLANKYYAEKGMNAVTSKES